jgi:predicted transcriptional regulator/transcriptional regulator with XRE-family HTH domain
MTALQVSASPGPEAMGRKLRELRQARELPQAEVAAKLGVSPAYLSLIETGKRPLQLPLLVQALELFGVELDDFMQSLGEVHLDEGLARLLDEPLLRTLALSRDDLARLGAEPRVANTITALFNLYKNSRLQLEHLLTDMARKEREGQGAGTLAFDYTPFDEVTDFLEERRNWFEGLEERADALRAQHRLGDRPREEGLIDVLATLGVEVRTLRAEEIEGEGSVIRRLDPRGGSLTLSHDLPEHRRMFQLAHAVGLRLLDEEKLHEPIVKSANARHAETPRLLKIHLASYLAGAILLPYGPFFRDVQRTRYDVEHLGRIFDTSYETVAHRLCNLSDPRKSGVPFHFQRVDVAGNISKRYASTGLRFPHGTGSCPKWVVHTAFLTPHMIHRQYSVFPDGRTYFCFAKVIAEPIAGSLARGTVYAIGLGTHASDAKHLAYADDMPFVDPQKMAVPVGTSCRFCERTDCNQRAAPSYKFAFRVDEYTKKDNFFSPLVDEDAMPSAPVPITKKRRS